MNAVARWRQSVLLFLAARDQRERRLLGWAAAVAVLGLAYALLIDPALSGRAQLRRNLPGLHQQVAELQALAHEAGVLSARKTAPAVAVSQAGIEASLGRSGLTAQSVALSGDFIKVQLSAVPFAGIVGWLAELQGSARVAVTDAEIKALAEPGMVNAMLTLRQQKSE
jgi:general secretion pathway protein M